MQGNVQLSPLENTVFYAIEKAIKTYRQFAQSKIKSSNLDLTIDQWLILKTLSEHPDMMQKQIAELVFKDYASVTRIIELLVKRKLVVRQPHQSDGRRFQLNLTGEGKRMIQKISPIILDNRRQALMNVNEEQVHLIHKLMNRIINNCETTYKE